MRNKAITALIVLIGFMFNIPVETSNDSIYTNTINNASNYQEASVVKINEELLVQEISDFVTNKEVIKEEIPTEPVLIEAIPVETEPTESETVSIETDPIVTEYEYGVRMTPAVEINYENGVKNHTDPVDTSGYTYYGRMYITGYTPTCAHCCGSTEGITASGVPAIPGYTVAAGYEFPFGTTLYIEGYGYYVVEDRGNLGTNVLDIATPDHESCYPITQDGVNVYIVPNKFHNTDKGE